MMTISFDALRVGAEYDRPYLAQLWGYESHHAISRGVITPSGTNIMVLFVTKEKQQALTQYNDYLDGDTLHWEGEEKHGSDDRLIHAESRGDRIYLFYRERHHMPFTYHGPIELRSYTRKTEQPSSFEFRVLEFANPDRNDPFQDIEDHKVGLRSLDETERRAVIQSRVGQGRFRKDVLALWEGCSVTGVNDERVLKASHVMPWGDSSNQQRLDPHNGLALVPNLDTLFDSGLISFDKTGQMRVVEGVSSELLVKLGIESSMKLQAMPARLERYLQHHRRHVFKGSWHPTWGAVAGEGNRHA
jgi:hypothetical protein